MDFRLDNDQLALQDAVSAFCVARYPVERIGERDGAAVTPAQWQELADLGVFALLDPGPDTHIGLVEAALVFEQLGRFLVGGPIVWSTLAGSVPNSAIDGTSVVGGLDSVGAGSEPLIVEHAAELDSLVVLRADGVYVIDRADLPVPDELESLDPLTPVGRFGDLPDGARVAGPDEADRIRDRGAVLSAAMLLGISETALGIARDYSLEREQFGRPIAAFQALQHLMADMFVRTSLARSATYAAAAVLDDPTVGNVPRSVSAAKLLAGEAAIENSRAAVQVLGGMGFTWEMLPHYLLKRAWVLEHSFGTSTSHALGISSSLEASTSSDGTSLEGRSLVGTSLEGTSSAGTAR